MSSHSSNYIEIRPITEDSSSLVDLERLARELSPTTSERVLLSMHIGIFIPELGCKIQSVCQLTSNNLLALSMNNTSKS